MMKKLFRQFRYGEKGFTLIELLIVVAILGVLAAVVIPNVIGLLGRGGAQAYDTDEEVIQLAAATFYSDLQMGWDDPGDNDDVGTYTDNVWSANSTTTLSGHYFPTAIANSANHVLVLEPGTIDGEGNPQVQVYVAGGADTVAADADISAHAMWMGLLVNGPGERSPTVAGLDGATTGNRMLVSPWPLYTGPYLNELPESAGVANGAPSTRAGGYTWCVGKNGVVFGAYQGSDNNWYAGFSGAYP
jgi:prepilin-type N-terminal cleavage/methylation domain-containing protein